MSNIKNTISVNCGIALISPSKINWLLF